MQSHHSDALHSHLGYDRTLATMKARFYWPGLATDLQAFIKSCLLCQSKKSPPLRQAGFLQSSTVSQPWDTLCIDYLGPFPKSDSGNQYVLVATDALTKYAMCFPVAKADSASSMRCLRKIVTTFGAPKRVLSDNGSHFTAQAFRNLCDSLGIKKPFSTAYHPQTNGLTERFNRTLCNMISMYIGDQQSSWDALIDAHCFAYNTSVQDSIKETPFFLMFGRDALTPVDVVLFPDVLPMPSIADHRSDSLLARNNALNRARQYLNTARHRQAKRYDKSHRHTEFQLGDLVLVYFPNRPPGSSKKFVHPWRGPYRIIGIKSPLVYELQHVEMRKKVALVHVQRIKPFFAPSFTTVSDSRATKSTVAGRP